MSEDQNLKKPFGLLTEVAAGLTQKAPKALELPAEISPPPENPFNFIKEKLEAAAEAEFYTPPPQKSQAKFTPEDVVAAYKTKNLRAIRQLTNLKVRDGLYVADQEHGAACAIGAMAMGQTAPNIPYNHEFIAAQMLGVNYVSFFHGFDGSPMSVRDVKEDYDLGVACAKAVEEAGLFVSDAEADAQMKQHINRPRLKSIL